MSARMDRRSFLRVTGAAAAAAAAGPAVIRPRPSEAQDPNTLVVAWDSDIDTLDPSAFKSNGGYVTIANICDGP
ncbi:MAG: twin-arginine translocation signal domain-containing protein, partial [Candidatus Rokubacteria bacterium]|nr:twin-arginine translocation signal domain-containing protein [Candidatus Rokubacteria bacterium]